MSLAIVINTTDKYCDLWDTWYYYFRKWKHDYPVYFLNEKLDVPYDVTQIKVDIPEKNLWTKKFRESLKQIPEEDVLVMLEDHWIVEPFKDNEFDELYGLFGAIRADSMRIRQKSDLTTTEPLSDVLSLIRLFWFRLFNHYNFLLPYHLSADSKYLISHDPCMWKKSFLLKCIDVDESPWANEIRGTERTRGQKHNIYHYEKHWWINAMVKGKLTPEGQKMLI